MSSPRIFGIPATRARLVAIIRRGPSDWVHVGAWDVEADKYTPGAWLRGTLYPQKCDLSPDGRWFVYSAMKHADEWPAGNVYEAVSRLPWVRALAAWGSGTTYTRGLHFTTEPADPGPPDVGRVEPILKRFGLAWTEPVQYAVERRRGWVESAETPPRDHGGPWDERRLVKMEKPQPGGSWFLRVEGRYAAFRSGDPADGPPVYSVSDRDDLFILEDAQWADWDRNGDLVIATTDGVLCRRRWPEEASAEIVDLSEIKPHPQPAPEWATRF